MIRAVLDTNVLVSGILGVEHSSKPPAELFRRLQARGFELVASGYILEELIRTLGNAYFSQRISPVEAAHAVSTIRQYAISVEFDLPVEATATHPEDDLILAAVASAQVDYLVTGDRQLQALRSFGHADIVSPAAFVAILDAAQ